MAARVASWHHRSTYREWCDRDGRSNPRSLRFGLDTDLSPDPVDDVVRRRLLISGRVQGVYYRDSTRREATAVGVRGSACNLADGRVEVVLEGEATSVDRVVAWCRMGPARAQVAAVEVVSEPPEGVSGFVIG
jgi:acylphosphatase